jgi:hypothetical protein
VTPSRSASTRSCSTCVGERSMETFISTNLPRAALRSNRRDSPYPRPASLPYRYWPGLRPSSFGPNHKADQAEHRHF